MLLQLERPLAFFDLETTGIRIGKDRIVQIGIVRLMPDGTRERYQNIYTAEHEHAHTLHTPFNPLECELHGSIFGRIVTMRAVR